MRRKLAVILAADVAGYSRLVADDEEGTLRQLGTSLDLFRDRITHHGGRIFNTAGDAILAEFPSALNAVRCAIEVQENLKTVNEEQASSRRLYMRVALHIGDVVEDDGNLLGDGVNVAARLEGIAPVGGVCISRMVHDTVASKLPVSFLDMGEQSLKNMPGPVRAFGLSILDPAWKPPRPEKRNEKGLMPLGRLMTIAGASALLIVVSGLWLLGAPQIPGKTSVPAAARSQTPAALTAKIAQEVTLPPAAVVGPAAKEVPSERVATSESRPASDAVQPSATPTTSREASTPPAPRNSTALLEVGNAGQPQKAVASEPKLEIEGQRSLEQCRRAQPADAIAPCTEALSRAGRPADVAEASLLLGKALREAGQLPAALAAYSRAIASSAGADAYLGRGIVHFDMRAFDKAIADFDKAIELEPQNGEALNNRAWTRYRAQDLRLALADADKAVALLPNRAYVWDTRAHIHEGLGQRDLAMRDYRKAIGLDPTSTSSVNGLQRVQGKR